MGVKASIITDPVAVLRHARQLVTSDPKSAAHQARRLLESYPGDPAVLRVLDATSAGDREESVFQPLVP